MNQDNAIKLCKKSYELINDKAGSNTVIQGLTGVLGFPFTLFADGAVIFTHYGTMLNEIRTLYNRTPVNEEIVTKIIKGISNEILFDLISDKILGQIPLIGIYFNAICAKTMTWRLGILFTMLASRGDEISETGAKESMKVVRLIFPQQDTFKFKQPNYQTFEKLILSVYENPLNEYQNKVHKALEAFE